MCVKGEFILALNVFLTSVCVCVCVRERERQKVRCLNRLNVVVLAWSGLVVASCGIFSSFVHKEIGPDFIRYQALKSLDITCMYVLVT